MKNDEAVCLESYHVVNGYIISACAANIDNEIWYAITLFSKEMELPYLIARTKSMAEATELFSASVKSLAFFFDGADKPKIQPSMN